MQMPCLLSHSSTSRDNQVQFLNHLKSTESQDISTETELLK